MGGSSSVVFSLGRLVLGFALLLEVAACGQIRFSSEQDGGGEDATPLDVGIEDVGLADGVAMRDGGPDAVDSRRDAGADARPTDAGPMDAGDDAGMDAGDDAGASGDCLDWRDGVFTFEVVGPVTTGDVLGERRELQLSADGTRLFFHSGGIVYEAPRTGMTTFAPATPVGGLSDSMLMLQGASFSPNELEAFAMRDGGSMIDIWRFTREAPSEDFEEDRALTEINTDGSDWDPLLTGDSMRLYTVRALPGSVRILQWERAGFSSPFTLSRTMSLDVGISMGNVSFLADESVLVFNSIPSGSTSNIYYARREEGGDFVTGTLLPGLGAEYATEPYLTPDGCELFYYGQMGKGRQVLLARYRSRIDS